MKVLAACFALLWAAAVAQSALFSGAQIVPIVAQFATRAQIGVAVDPAHPYYMTRSTHFARAAVTRLKIAIPCWYVLSNPTYFESSLGSDCDGVAAGIEYPAGVFTQVTFNGGSASTTITDLTTKESDWVTVSIPNGATFWVRILLHNATNVMNGQPPNTAIGDAADCSVVPVVDQTMGGTVANDCLTKIFYPAAIIAEISQPSLCLVGISRTWGTGDTADSSGDLGDVARSVGPNFGYIMVSKPGSTMDSFINSSTQRRNLITQYCNSVISGYGGNDIADSAAVYQSESRALWALFAGKHIYQTNLEPFTNSSGTCPGGGGWATQGDQSTNSSSAPRIVANSYYATLPAPLTQVFNVSTPVSVGANNWITNGTQCFYTDDGTHPTQAGYLLIAAAGAFPTSAFIWP